MTPRPARRTLAATLFIARHASAADPDPRPPRPWRRLRQYAGMALLVLAVMVATNLWAAAQESTASPAFQAAGTPTASGLTAYPVAIGAFAVENHGTAAATVTLASYQVLDAGGQPARYDTQPRPTGAPATWPKALTAQMTATVPAGGETRVALPPRGCEWVWQGVFPGNTAPTPDANSQLPAEATPLGPFGTAWYDLTRNRCPTPTPGAPGATSSPTAATATTTPVPPATATATSTPTAASTSAPSATATSAPPSPTETPTATTVPAVPAVTATTTATATTAATATSLPTSVPPTPTATPTPVPTTPPATATAPASATATVSPTSAPSATPPPSEAPITITLTIPRQAAQALLDLLAQLVTQLRAALGGG